MNQDIITNLITIGVAVIALSGVVYSASHVKEFDNIEKLVNAIEKLKKLQSGGANTDEKLTKAVTDLEERLAVETRKVQPFPKYLDLVFACLTIIAIGACKFITNPILGFTVAIIAVILFFVTLRLIPRSK
jgi:hypothetical protein